MKMVFVASIIRHKLYMIYGFLFIVQKSFLTKNHFPIAAINLTTRGPLYTCLVYYGSWWCYYFGPLHYDLLSCFILGLQNTILSREAELASIKDELDNLNDYKVTMPIDDSNNQLDFWLLMELLLISDVIA